ncbi:uncharacterized protein [Triticum aestivum]|uniref:uncharacterized protein isoform X2 n=1 Tax=Triticum aestivum TaxID=4565 RepID=UPI001D01788A|nr:uncharacterized protein LOC123169650 isoform X2 [Triticum aestivum]
MESGFSPSILTSVSYGSSGCGSEHVIRLATLIENSESQGLYDSPSEHTKIDGDRGSAEEDTSGSPRSEEGWVRRPRHGVMPDERKTKHDRVAPLEQALRGFANRKTDAVVAPSIGLVFDSLGEAYDFYNLYSWELGFGIRYGKSRTNVKGTKCMQELLCACSGNLRKAIQLLAVLSAQLCYVFYILKTNDGSYIRQELRRLQ